MTKHALLAQAIIFLLRHLMQVTFVGNAATSPLGVVTGLGTGVGGALYVEGATDAFNVTRCRFRSNSAQVGGGAVMLAGFQANASATVSTSAFAVTHFSRFPPRRNVLQPGCSMQLCPGVTTEASLSVIEHADMLALARGLPSCSMVGVRCSLLR